MDDFVRNKLTEWGLGGLIEKFEDEGIDEESLLCLDDQDIVNLIPKVGPRAKFREKLKLLKGQQNPTNQATVPACDNEEAADCDEVLPSTSDTNDNGKRVSAAQGESNQWRSPAKRNKDGFSEKAILSDVKEIMGFVHQRLEKEANTKLNDFLKTKICDLDKDKREQVGVFGKTGAGKSTLINAVIGRKDLLPSGSVSACTSVMIKVENNTHNSKYEAEIEFITKQDWKDELDQILWDNGDEETKPESDDVEKLSALYGEDWKNKSIDSLMDDKYFREIREFLQSKKKILSCESAKELSAKFVKYTRSDSSTGESEDVKRWYWPLVKCVTVKVPKNDLLQHVTLVDLPGNGDYNKSRDQMWKEIVGSCSAVWIVTDINRAASEKEAWEILESTSSLMGNGGECRFIHFICTKSDSEDSDDPSEHRALIFKRNMKAKEEVMAKFRKEKQIKKHFTEDCFRVFTVSSKQYLKGNTLKGKSQKLLLQSDDTEIPQLQEFLHELNNCHSETLNYVSGALGILSLIQGAGHTEVTGQKTEAGRELEEIMKSQLDNVRKSMEEAHKTFKKCLIEGVEMSKSSCEKKLKSVLFPKKARRGFYNTLRYMVRNNGKIKEKNLNAVLSSFLTDSIDEEFRKTFPNAVECGPYKGAINSFSLHTEGLIKKYKHAELQLAFLQTEEEKIKSKVNTMIRQRKKTIYSCLKDTIEAQMQGCYTKAAEFRGPGSLNNMRTTIQEHVHDSKDTMFEHAKDVMLSNLRALKEEILTELEQTLRKSIELSLMTDERSIPDVSKELEMVKRHHNDLMRSSDEDI